MGCVQQLELQELQVLESQEPMVLLRLELKAQLALQRL